MLAFEEAGSPANRPLIFVHGWCCNRGHMRELMTHFAGEASCYRRRSPWPWRSPSGRRFSFASIRSLRVSAPLSSSANYIDQSSSVIAWGASSVWWRLLGIPSLLAGVVNLDGAVPDHRFRA